MIPVHVAYAYIFNNNQLKEIKLHTVYQGTEGRNQILEFSHTCVFNDLVCSKSQVYRIWIQMKSLYIFTKYRCCFQIQQKKYMNAFKNLEHFKTVTVLINCLLSPFSDLLAPANFSTPSYLLRHWSRTGLCLGGYVNNIRSLLFLYLW